MFIIAEIGLHIHSAGVFGDAHKIIGKSYVFGGIPFHLSAFKPAVFKLYQLAQRSRLIWVSRRAVYPCVAEFIGNNGQFAALFPNDIRKFVKRARFCGISGKFILYLFQLFGYLFRLWCTAVVQRVVKIKYLINKLAFKRAAVVARICELLQTSGKIFI